MHTPAGAHCTAASSLAHLQRFAALMPPSLDLTMPYELPLGAAHEHAHMVQRAHRSNTHQSLKTILINRT